MERKKTQPRQICTRRERYRERQRDRERTRAMQTYALKHFAMEKGNEIGAGKKTTINYTGSAHAHAPRHKTIPC